MQRACAAALLSKGETVIHRPGKSNDDLAAMDVISKLGARISKQQNGDLHVISEGVNPLSNEINCGESGLGIRMFAPLVALSDREILINGSGSLLKRPMDFFDEIFPSLGIRIQSNNGKLPLKIQGPLKPANITIDGSLSSQFLTGLLMAYAAANASDVSIHVKDLKSKPYIDLTLHILKQFGVHVENRNYEEFYFGSNSGSLKPTSYTVEGDWSGGAFLLVAGAIAGTTVVEGLDVQSTQADKAILSALKDSGAEMLISENKIEIGPAELKAFEFDATDCPDLFPPLVSLAACCKGITSITGVSRLAHKESNRALTLQEEFGKMGIEVELIDNVMKVHGSQNLKGAIVHSHHDHRIAMACAVAGLVANGETVIEEADAINKSYPDFYNDLIKLNASVNIGQLIK
jgi:3-phosphoshikimate 1-carboxyvinyltransferase